MQVVYFPEELNARAPTVMGVLCDASTNTWVTLFDIVDFIKAGETVTIRPASEQELQRAEGRIALYEIGVALGAQVAALLDHEPVKETVQKLEGLGDVIASYELGLPKLVSDTEVSVAAEPVDESLDDEILVCCSNLYTAYAACDIATARTMANRVTAILSDIATLMPSDDRGVGHAN